MERLKILHLATGYTPIQPNSKRSVETNLYQLTKEQARLGHNVIIIDIKSPNRDKTGVGFYEVWQPPLTGNNLIGYFLKVIIFTLQLPTALYRNKNADIIHTHSQFPTAMVIICKKLFKLGAQIFYTAHSPYLTMPSNLGNKLKHTLIEGWALRGVDRVVVHTKAVSKMINQQFGVKPTRVIQVYDGVPTGEINKFIEQNPPRKNDSKLVLQVGFVNPRKNQMAVVEAIPLISEAIPDCNFIFIGAIEDESYYTKIQAFLTMQGINNVQFMGQVPKDKLYWLYQEASIMIFPTLFETQGVVLLEAMAFGLPVIASNIEVIKDVVKLKKDCALLVNPNNNQEIGEAIVLLLSNKSLWNRLSTRGKDLVYSRFSWDRIAQDMVKEYDKASK